MAENYTMDKRNSGSESTKSREELFEDVDLDEPSKERTEMDDEKAGDVEGKKCSDGDVETDSMQIQSGNINVRETVSQESDFPKSESEKPIFITVSLEEDCSFCHVDTGERLERCFLCFDDNEDDDDDGGDHDQKVAKKYAHHPDNLLAHRTCFEKDHEVLKQSKKESVSLLPSAIDVVGCLISPCTSPHRRKRSRETANRPTSPFSSQSTPMASPRHSPCRSPRRESEREKGNVWSTYTQMHRSVSLHGLQDKVPVYDKKLWDRQLSVGGGRRVSLWSLRNEETLNRGRKASPDLKENKHIMASDELSPTTLDCSPQLFLKHHNAPLPDPISGHNAPSQLSHNVPLASSHNVLPDAEKHVDVVAAKLYNLSTGRRLSLSHDSLNTMPVSRI